MGLRGRKSPKSPLKIPKLGRHCFLEIETEKKSKYPTLDVFWWKIMENMRCDCRMYALVLCISAGFKSQTHKAGRNSGPTFPKVRLHLGKKKGKTMQLPQMGISSFQFLNTSSLDLNLLQYVIKMESYGVVWSCIFNVYIYIHCTLWSQDTLQSHTKSWWIPTRSFVTGFTFSRSTAIFIATTPSSSAYQESTKPNLIPN